ncbi:hypothetical protein SASPL_148036 [Salvia splendens]|uniref:Uncharacterized protein n=1 Tax=Salvia splendens TaxID=180675 RepID=A0A8X8W9I4_SALSN|nr:hypothetical protein SASPL_148036 [Salvia splendens]
MGWPFLGENMELTTLGSQKLVRDRMQKYSQDVFKTSLLGEKMAVLCGLDATKHQEPKANFHNFQYDILKPDALKQYVPVMDSSVVEALPSAKKYALSLACRVFMGKEDWENVSDFSENFSLMTKGILSLPVNLPGTAMNRAMEGGRVVRRELMRIVGERRREMIKGEDLLSKMVVATNEDGECMSDGMVVNVILGLLIGAEHELSSLITIVLYYLAELPHIYDRVFKGTFGVTLYY